VFYLSKPNGTFGVFYPSRHSQGAFDVHKLVPGHRYGGMGGGPSHSTYEGTRDREQQAVELADRLDAHAEL
jgi:hypothetical protein